jgi:hypothetical protein
MSLKRHWFTEENFQVSDLIIIIDDKDFITSDEFGTLISYGKCNYYLLISRKKYPNLNYSPNKMHTMKNNEIEHWLENKNLNT